MELSKAYFRHMLRHGGLVVVDPKEADVPPALKQEERITLKFSPSAIISLGGIEEQLHYPGGWHNTFVAWSVMQPKLRLV